MLEQIEFPQYTKEEMFGILKQRVELALQENCINDNVIGSIALKASELKDIRIGLFLLRESALIAEEKASRQIKQEHVDIAITKINQFTIKNTDELDEEAKNILKIIKDNSGKKIGDLFKVYEKAGGKSSYKTFQRKINKLDEGKFISLERTYAGGNTTIVNKKLTEY